MIPEGIRKATATKLRYAGKATSPEQYLGGWITTALAAGLAAFAIVRLLHQPYAGIAAAFVFLFAQFMAYLLLYFKIESRRKQVERVLPDCIQMIASNLRSGMTPFQALRASNRTEFGILKEEIEQAIERSLGTESFEESLLSIRNHVKSEMLDRALRLFTTAMRSGAHLADLLENLSQDLSELQMLKKDLVTTTKTYTMFILFTVIVGAPMLLAVSIRFVGIMADMQQRSDIFGSIAITPEFLTMASVILLVVTSLLSASLIGVIKEGKVLSGLLYFPFIAGACLAMFAAFRAGVGAVS